MIKFLTLIATVFSLFGTMGQAQQVGDVTLWSGLSTFGVSYEGGYQIAPEFRLRGGWMGGVNVDETQTEDGAIQEIDASLGAVSVLLDYSPVDAGWRMSGGLLFSRTSLDSTLRGSLDNPIEYDGQSFADGMVSSGAVFKRSAAPMVTAGYDYPLSEKWVISGEVGAIFVGGLDLTVTGDSAALQDAIDNDDEVQKSLDDAADFSIYPYINLSVGYLF